MYSDETLVCGIDPRRLYSFGEARKLIPSPRTGKQTHLQTMHALRRSGRLNCVPRPTGRIRHWFVWGSEILRFIGADKNPPPAPPVSEAQRCRHIEAAQREGRRLGLLPPEPESPAAERRQRRRIEAAKRESRKLGLLK
jgi:hypothetical protein